MASYSLSKVQSFVEGFATGGLWVGVDVHKRSYHVALRREDGHYLTWVGPADPKQFVQRLLDIGVVVHGVAQEAGPTGFTLARTLKDAGIECIVAAPSKIPRPVRPGSKTDRLDCIKLAEYAAKGMLRCIAIPNEEEEAERMLMRRRHKIVDNLRKTKQSIKSLLLEAGVPEPAGLANWSQGAMETLDALPLGRGVKSALGSTLRELRFLQSELREVESEVRSLAESKRHERAMRGMRSVPGVGLIVAATFRLEIFRPERFDRKEELASYLGLAPTVRHSGEKTPRGRLVPVGQKRLRSLLIEAAWMWRARDEQARETYNRLLARSGIPQKAIAALARRLAIILWRLCLEDRPYRVCMANG